MSGHTRREAKAGEQVIDGDRVRDATPGEELVACGSMLMTVETARASGLLPQQILARRRVDVAVLDAYGHGDTAEARALRLDVASREGIDPEAIQKAGLA